MAHDLSQSVQHILETRYAGTGAVPGVPDETKTEAVWVDPTVVDPYGKHVSTDSGLRTDLGGTVVAGQSTESNNGSAATPGDGTDAPTLTETTSTATGVSQSEGSDSAEAATNKQPSGNSTAEDASYT